MVFLPLLTQSRQRSLQLWLWKGPNHWLLVSGKAQSPAFQNKADTEVLKLQVLEHPHKVICKSTRRPAQTYLMNPIFTAKINMLHCNSDPKSSFTYPHHCTGSELSVAVLLKSMTNFKVSCYICVWLTLICQVNWKGSWVSIFNLITSIGRLQNRATESNEWCHLMYTDYSHMLSPASFF